MAVSADELEALENKAADALAGLIDEWLPHGGEERAVETAEAAAVASCLLAITTVRIADALLDIKQALWDILEAIEKR